MPVTYDATGTNHVTLGTTVAVTLTVGSGTNMAVMVGLGFGVNSTSGISVTGAGASGWALVSGTDTGSAVTRRTLIWAATNPSSGAQAVTATWTGNADCVIGVVTAAGVNQTTPVINGTNQTQLSATSDALVITSKAGDLTMDAVAVLATLSAPTQTQRWLDNTLATVDSGGSTGAGAATVSHGWSASVGSDWAHSGADFNQATSLDEGALVAGAQAPGATRALLLGIGDEFPPVSNLEDVAPAVGAKSLSASTITIPVGISDESTMPSTLEDIAPSVGAKSLSASTSIALVGLSNEVGLVTPIDDIAPPVGATSISASTVVALVGISDDAPTILPIDEFVTIISIEEWETQLGRTVWYDETGGVVVVPPPPGIGLRVLLRGLGLAPVYGSLAELAPSGIVYALLQFDASYPAGGYPLSPRSLGFTTKALTFLPTKALVMSQGYFPVYDGANRTVRLFRAVAGQWVEPSAGTDLSRVVMDVAIAGY